MYFNDERCRLTKTQTWQGQGQEHKDHHCFTLKCSVRGVAQMVAAKEALTWISVSSLGMRIFFCSCSYQQEVDDSSGVGTQTIAI